MMVQDHISIIQFGRFTIFTCR